jgi:hypothetical protein
LSLKTLLKGRVESKMKRKERTANNVLVISNNIKKNVCLKCQKLKAQVEMKALLAASFTKDRLLEEKSSTHTMLEKPKSLE